ncbi:hypothetical protein ACH3XW_43745 [Acanthocheilonema viteae]
MLIAALLPVPLVDMHSGLFLVLSMVNLREFEVVMLRYMLASIICQSVFSSVSSQEYICPDDVMYLDLKPCNPNDRNQCPKNFACRRSRLSRSGTITNEIIHLCCEANNMTIGSWFEELELSPQIFPQYPSSILDYVNISSYDAKYPSPVVHLGDELQVLNYPNYITANIRAFQFQSIIPARGGYLHVVSLIDITKRPSALFINYDLPSTGSASVNTENITDSKHHFFGYISNGTISVQDTYRQQYVVIVYKTEFPLSDHVNVTADIIRFIDQISYFISNSATGRALGKPIAGLFFYITSKRTLFPTQPKPQPMPPYLPHRSKSSTICNRNFILACWHTWINVESIENGNDATENYVDSF